MTTERSPNGTIKTAMATLAGAGGAMGLYAMSGQALSDIYQEIGTLGLLVVAIVYGGMWLLRRIDLDSQRRDREWEAREQRFYGELQARRDEHNREIERRDIMLDRMATSIERSTIALEQISDSVKALRDDMDRVRDDLDNLRTAIRIHPDSL